MRKVFFSIVVLYFCTLFSNFALAKEYRFDTDLLGNGVSDEELSNLAKGRQPPGEYLVNIYLNDVFIDSRKVNFFIEKNDIESQENQLAPCLPAKLLKSYGIIVEANAKIKEECYKISNIPQATFEFDFNEQTLELTIPPSFVVAKQSGIVPVDRWDEGISAFRMNYRLDGQHLENTYSRNRNKNDDIYGQFTPGLNLGAWRVKNLITWERGSSENKWKSSYAAATRGIADLKSRLTIGNSYTSGDIFNSFLVRGVTLASDDNMTASTQREFVPVIRGIARSHATVDIKQHDYTLFHTVVPPGPFVINNMPSAPAEGNIDVIVTESNGERKVSTVQYTKPPVALHRGYFRYTLTAGKLRPSGNTQGFDLHQATLMYGLPLNITFFAGFQTAKEYMSTAEGLSILLGRLGAVSADLTQNNDNRFPGKRLRGQSARIRYRWIAGKKFSTWIAARHLSSDYTAIDDTSTSDFIRYKDRIRAPKDDQQAGITLPLDQFGELNFNIARTIYHYDNKEIFSSSLSYDVSLLDDIFMSINFSKLISLQGKRDNSRENQLNVSFSIPLTRFLKGARASYALNSSQQRSDQMSIQGEAGEQQYNWLLNVGHQQQRGRDSRYISAASIAYRGTYGEYGASILDSPNSKTYAGSVSGGVIIHQHGITAGQTMDNSVVLMQIPGVAGIQAGNIPGEKTDFRGYAIINGMSAYQENELALDPVMLPNTIAISQTERIVVPTEGAIVSATFSARHGHNIFFRVKAPDGRWIPFGAVASLSSESTVTAIAGNNGTLFMSGMPVKDKIDIIYGKNKHCTAEYRIPEKENSKFIHLNIDCD